MEDDTHLDALPVVSDRRRRHRWEFGAAVLIAAAAPLAALFGLAAFLCVNLLAPFAAGTLAARHARIPVFGGASACALGSLICVFFSSLVWGGTEFGRDFVPLALLVMYYTTVGGFSAWLYAKDLTKRST